MQLYLEGLVEALAIRPAGIRSLTEVSTTSIFSENLTPTRDACVYRCQVQLAYPSELHIEYYTGTGSFTGQALTSVGTLAASKGYTFDILVRKAFSYNFQTPSAAGTIALIQVDEIGTA